VAWPSRLWCKPGSCTVIQRINQLLTIGVIRFGSVPLLYFLWRCSNPDPLVFPMPCQPVPCRWRQAHPCLPQRNCERFCSLCCVTPWNAWKGPYFYLDSNLAEDTAPLNRDIHKRQPTWLVTRFRLLDACSNMVYWRWYVIVKSIAFSVQWHLWSSFQNDQPVPLWLAFAMRNKLLCIRTAWPRFLLRRDGEHTE